MRALPIALSLCVVLGCGDDDTTPTTDAGSGGGDAGVRRDGGGGVDDGGVEPPPLEGCEGGPLAEPIPSCRPAPLPTTGDLRQDCVQRINQLRWECQCLGPLARWTEAEACADEHAAYDAEGAGPHGGFRDDICSPRGRAQNECPGYRDDDQVIGLCLQQMWDEGPGADFQMHGHYLNMTNPAHSRVACGFYTTSSGRVWAVQNFQ